MINEVGNTFGFLHGNWSQWWLLLPLQAERVFSEVRRLECHRVEGMEIFSTTLWHLQKDVALSALAKDLTDLDRDCPEVSRFTDSMICTETILK